MSIRRGLQPGPSIAVAGDRPLPGCSPTGQRASDRSAGCVQPTDPPEGIVKAPVADSPTSGFVEVDELEAPGARRIGRNAAHVDRGQVGHAKGGQGSGAGADRSAHLSA